ncbi:MAG TPA: hypothetical protein DCF68_19850 [Cyanothece sp. UBA12306]|nr:hypothetical protein [Cyanothece sp. UBA12306]
MSNRLDRQDLTDKDQILEEKLLFGKKEEKPKPQEIIELLNGTYDLVRNTNKKNDFEFALNLLHKWNLILLTFYEEKYINHIYSVCRDIDSFRDEPTDTISITAKEKQKWQKWDEKVPESSLEVWGVKSNLDDVMTQKEEGEDLSAIPHLSQEKEDELLDSVLFRG